MKPPSVFISRHGAGWGEAFFFSFPNPKSNSFQIMSHICSETSALRPAGPVCWCQICRGFVGLCVLFKLLQEGIGEGGEPGGARGVITAESGAVRLAPHNTPSTPPPIPRPLQCVLMRLQSAFFPALQEPLFVPAAIRHQTVQSFLPHWSRAEPARSALRQEAGYRRLFVLIATLNSSAHMSHQPLTPKYINISL